MNELKHIAIKSIVYFYFEIKRNLYQLRYPNLKLARGVKIKGSLSIRGSVKVTVASGSRLGKIVKIIGSGEVKVGKNVSLNGCWIGCQKPSY